MTDQPIPIACSLSTIDSARQVASWRDLGLHASDFERLDGGFVATFPIHVAQTVQALADREAECCRFLAIRTTQGTGAVRLEITAGEDAQPVVEALAIAVGG